MPPPKAFVLEMLTRAAEPYVLIGVNADHPDVHIPTTLHAPGPAITLFLEAATARILAYGHGQIAYSEGLDGWVPTPENPIGVRVRIPWDAVYLLTNQERTAGAFWEDAAPAIVRAATGNTKPVLRVVETDRLVMDDRADDEPPLPTRSPPKRGHLVRVK